MPHKNPFLYALCFAGGVKFVAIVEKRQDTYFVSLFGPKKIWSATDGEKIQKLAKGTARRVKGFNFWDKSAEYYKYSLAAKTLADAIEEACHVLGQFSVVYCVTYHYLHGLTITVKEFNAENPTLYIGATRQPFASRLDAFEEI